jgi:hypothetical protein
MRGIARAVGLTVIRPKLERHWQRPKVGRFLDMPGPWLPTFDPDLPKMEPEPSRLPHWWPSWYDHKDWIDEFPTQRHKLPDYVPEVAAGVPSPMILSDWKIKAMRVCVWVERNRIIERKQFRALGIDPSRWMTGHWLTRAPERGQWIAGPGFPADQFRREHPSVYAMVEADYEEWSIKVPKIEATPQRDLL